MSVRPKPIPGVEIRERRPRGGEVVYSYRVRFKNARGKRDQRSFDTAQDAQDFRARLRLLKRTGDLAVLERGNEALERFMGDFWRLYVETRLETSTRKKYRCLWNVHINRRLGAMELRQITPLVLSEFILELEEAGAGAATIRSCLGLLQSMFARAVEWDRASVNVVKLIAKPRVRRKRTIKPLRPIDVEALRRQMLLNSDSEWMGHSPATLLSHYAHVIADLASKPSSPNENAIKVARRTRRFYGQRSQIVPPGNQHYYLLVLMTNRWFSGPRGEARCPINPHFHELCLALLVLAHREAIAGSGGA